MQDKGIITLENMRSMNIDQIIELYKNGYKIEDQNFALQTTTCPSGCINIGYALALGSVILALTVGAISTYLSRKGKI